MPYEHFSSASGELSLLFRDGHFYGCIALTQAVAEAIVRFLCFKKFKNASEKFEDNVKRLCKENALSKEMKKSFLNIWEHRNDFHHLNATIEQNRKKLEKMALEKLRLLIEIESELFSYTISKGALIPKNRDFWKITGNHNEVPF